MNTATLNDRRPRVSFAPPDGPPDGQDALRMNWLAAQGDLSIQQFVLISGEPLVELVDETGEVIGRGASLHAAVDDAMGGPGHG